jgi:hypothetical protein
VAPRPSRPAHAGAGERREIAGPQQITRDEWERLVGSMMQVRVAADGRPAEPEPFAASGKDGWERWNQERDAAAP